MLSEKDHQLVGFWQAYREQESITADLQDEITTLSEQLQEYQMATLEPGTPITKSVFSKYNTGLPQSGSRGSDQNTPSFRPSFYEQSSRRAGLLQLDPMFINYDDGSEINGGR